MSQMQNVSGTVNRRAVVIFIAGMLCFWASMYVFVPVFPVYAEKMGAPLNIVGLAVGAYGLTQMLLRIPIGIWSDSIGRRRRFVVAGMMICAISGAGLALAPNPFWLVIFRGVMGISAATWVCSTVLFVSYFPPGNSSVPLAIMSFTSSIGQVLATSAGGILTEVGGWAAPFWVSVGLSLIAGVILLFAPEDHTTASINVSLKWMTQIVQAPLLLLASGVGIILYFATTSTVLGFTPVLAERLGATRTELGLLTAAALLSCGIATLFAPRLIRLLGVRAALLSMMAITQRSDQEVWQQDINARAKNINELTRRVLERNRNNPRLSGKLAELDTIREAFAQTRDTIIPLIYAGKTEQARALALGIQDERYLKMRAIAQQLGNEAVNRRAPPWQNPNSGRMKRCAS